MGGRTKLGHEKMARVRSAGNGVWEWISTSGKVKQPFLGTYFWVLLLCLWTFSIIHHSQWDFFPSDSNEPWVNYRCKSHGMILLVSPNHFNVLRRKSVKLPQLFSHPHLPQRLPLFKAGTSFGGNKMPGNKCLKWKGKLSEDLRSTLPEMGKKQVWS